MQQNFKIILNRVRFYIFLLGGFLGLEIPLLVFTYFRYFPTLRNFVWVVTILMGIASAGIVYYMIGQIIDEDYKLKILFGVDSTAPVKSKEIFPNEKLSERKKTANTSVAHASAAEPAVNFIQPEPAAPAESVSGLNKATLNAEAEKRNDIPPVYLFSSGADKIAQKQTADNSTLSSMREKLMDSLTKLDSMSTKLHSESMGEKI